VPSRRHIIVVDPAVRVAEVDCVNRMSLASKLPLTYHLPGLVGMESLQSETMDGAAGIIVLGSGTSVYESREWQRPLEQWLRPFIDKGVPCLGICYGHQMLAHMFGATVGFMHEDKRKRVGFHRVDLEPDLLWGGRALASDLFMSHREAVTSCPKDMRVVGKSLDVAIEALVHKQLPVWSFQAHPEATASFVKGAGAQVPTDDKAYAHGWGIVGAFLAFAASSGDG
jgi:GMP synthase-like glutamine amidotransferase